MRRSEPHNVEPRDHPGPERVHLRELYLGKLTDEFRPRRQGVPLPFPSGHLQGLDTDHERRY